MRILLEFYLTARFLFTAAVVSLLFFLAYFVTQIFFISKLLLIVFISVFVFEIIILFSKKAAIYAERILADRLSNGDDNEIKIILTNNYTVKIKIIDELPFIFQIRDFEINFDIQPGKTKIFNYNLRPVKRGGYQFGALNIYASTVFHLVRRRFRFDQNKNVAVYPSYL